MKSYHRFKEELSDNATQRENNAEKRARRKERLKTAADSNHTNHMRPKLFHTNNIG